MRSRARAVGLLALLVGALLLLGTTPVSAHAYLVGSDPGDGARLERAPGTLRLDFTEHVVLGATRLVLVDGHGRTVAVRDIRVVSDDADSEEPSAITAALPTLAADAYRLQWETLSADDLHRTSGVIRFGIGRDVSPAAAARAPIRWSESVLHGSMLLATAVAVGGLLAPRTRSSAGRRAAPLAAWLACLLCVALLLDQVAGSGSTLSATFAGGYGARWLLRVGGLVLLAAALSRSWPRLAWVGLVASGLGAALLGHIGAAGNGAAFVVMSACHVTAALLWSGGVLWLAASATGRWRRRDVAGAVRDLRAFGGPAAACLSVVVVTGVALSSSVVATVDAALMSTYGRVLAAKVLLVASAVALAGLNHQRLRDSRDPGVPGRGIAGEAFVMGAVLGLTGLLTSAGSATDPSFRAAPAPSSGAVGRAVADLQVSAGLSPNAPGRAVTLVAVFDTRRPAPGPVTGVDVALGNGSPTSAVALGDGHWSAPVTVGSPGTTSIRVTVHRAGLSDASTTLDWTVGGGPARHGVIVSQAPLAGGLLLGAGALAGLLTFVWGVVLLRTRHVRPAVGLIADAFPNGYETVYRPGRQDHPPAGVPTDPAVT